MRPRRQLRATPYVLALAAGLLPAAMLGIHLAAPDRLLQHAYTRSLGSTDLTWSEPSDPRLILSRTTVSTPHIQRAFAVGDRMTIDGRGGTLQSIEVVAIEQVDGAGLGLDGVNFQMVTGRPDHAGAGETVRFLFAVDAPADQPRQPKRESAS